MVDYDNKEEYEKYINKVIDISKAGSKRVWAIYKGGEEAGKTRNDLTKLETRIKELEEQNNWDSVNFDLRWASKTNTTVSGEVKATVNNPQTNENTYTISQAEEEVSEKEFNELKPFLDKALAMKKLAIKYIVEKDPTLENPAASGQVLNMANYAQQLDKLCKAIGEVDGKKKKD